MPSLKKNIAYNFTYQLLILALPLVTAPYLSRVIGADGIGQYTYSYSIATYFVYLVKLGLDNYGNRAIASAQDSREVRSLLFSEIYAMQALCFVVAGTLYATYALFFSTDSMIALLQGIYVLSALFDVNWFFFGIEQFRITVIRNTIVKTLTVVFVFIFVRDAGDVVSYVAVMSTGFLVSQVALWPFLRRYIDFIKPSAKGVVSHLRPNLVLFVPVIAVSIYNVLSKIILGAISGPEAVGFFDNAVKIIQVPVALVAAVGTVMLPRSSALVAKGEQAAAARHTEKTLIYVMAFTAIAAFGIPRIAQPFTELFYGPGFELTSECMVVLCATIPLLGFGNVIRTQYLIPSGKDQVFLWSAVCGAIASVVSNILLVPSFGCLGAALASVAAETSVLLFQVFMVRKEIPLLRYLTIALSFLTSGALMWLMLMAVPSFGDRLLDIVFYVLIGIFVFCVFSLATVKPLGVRLVDILPRLNIGTKKQ